MTLIELSATEAIGKIRNGEITSEELVQACLDRIEQVDGDIEAWTNSSEVMSPVSCSVWRKVFPPVLPDFGAAFRFG